jgi:gp16 family phage-associated protein
MKPRYKLTPDGIVLVTNLHSPRTPDQAKQALYEKGITLKEFAQGRGFKYRTVSEVIRGVNKGLYGEGHQVAVALGIKSSAA